MYIFSEPEPNKASGGEETEMLFSNGLKSKVRIWPFQRTAEGSGGLLLLSQRGFLPLSPLIGGKTHFRGPG